MRTIFVSILVLIGFIAKAQRECVTSQYLQQQQKANPAFASRLTAIESFLQNKQTGEIAARANGGPAGESVIRIPVVVHVIYNQLSQNISEDRIKSQIDALNRDFRRQNADTGKTPERFKHLAADVRIEFVLATADPDGRSTNGITRRHTTVREFEMDDRIKSLGKGGTNAWDTRYYLNIWVGPLYRLLGYSTFPGSDASVDGVVINTSAFGTIGVSGPYNLGRTATHEVGHWLGLRHIWGDDFCGDDLVHDTPKQGNFTVGCPTGFRSSCDNGSTGDMYMNYMDFTDDVCLNLFTRGQKDRMRSMLSSGAPRADLLSSKGLSAAWNHSAPPEPEKPFEAAPLKFYPNPAVGEITLNFEQDSSWIGKELSVVNVNGILLKKMPILQNHQKINLSDLKPGLYFLTGENGENKMKAKLVKL